MDATRKRRLLIATAAVAAVAVALSLAWRYTALAEVVTLGNAVGLIESFSAKWWAPFLLALFYTPASMIMFPRPLLTLAAALVFGPWKGFTIAIGGVVLSAFILYSIGRRVKESTVRRLAGPRIDRLTRLLRREGFMAIAAVGFLPVAPFSIEMIVAGALRVRLRDLLLGVTVAHLPGTILTTLLGGQFNAALRHGQEINRAVIALVVVVFITLFFVTRHLWRRMEAQA
jgi:phospholipase D1/2